MLCVVEKGEVKCCWRKFVLIDTLDEMFIWLERRRKNQMIGKEIKCGEHL
jgi:hypothetical protein